MKLMIIGLLVCLVLGNVGAWAQAKETEKIKTDATLPPEIKHYEARLGNYNQPTVTRDSLLILSDQKIRVVESSNNKVYEVKKYICTYAPLKKDFVYLKVEGDLLTEKIKTLIQGSENGDIFYIEAIIVKEDGLTQSVMLAFRVK